ncbi:hypothetical protein M5689_020787 [Euphorbia peplus]|nr:hypothetical protein M5689_020787 [Euphorbia peplus]
MSVPFRRGVVRATRDWPKGCGPNKNDTSAFCAPHRFCVSSSLEDDQNLSLDSVVPESERKPSLEGSNEVESVRSKTDGTQCLCCSGKDLESPNFSSKDMEIQKLLVAKLLRDKAERVSKCSKIPLNRRPGRHPSHSDSKGPTYVDPQFP